MTPDTSVVRLWKSRRPLTHDSEMLLLSSDQRLQSFTLVAMRDSTKVIIGFGSIWGLFAFGILLFGSFTLGSNDSAPEVVAIVLYGLTVLPSCILAIWFRKRAARWLIILTPIASFGFIYQVIAQKSGDRTTRTIAADLIFPVIVALIPALIGTLLLRAEPKQEKK